MTQTSPTATLTRTSILAAVWPIVLANISAPLLGLADTAVIGRYGAVEALGAIALGSLVFSFVYWAFGFLRMSTTGFVAQADGSRDEAELRASVLRPLLMGALLGLALWALQRPIAVLAFALLDGTAAVESQALSYFQVRIWGAPAALATYAVVGTLIGLNKTRFLLVLQVFINGLNLGLDLLLAGPMQMGVEGIALGTALAEWVGLLLGLIMLAVLARQRGVVATSWGALLDRTRLAGMFGAQRDLMLRTLLLLGGFAWFTNQGAKFGDTTLAANHLLLQLVSFSAFLLDGFAFATESFVGRAYGAGDRALFDRSVRVTSELALVTSWLLALLVLWGGNFAIEGLTDLQPVREIAQAYLGYAAVYIALSVAAFQLDGIFIGATLTKSMRDASFSSLSGFLLLCLVLVPRWGNSGLWTAFIAYVVLRAVALGWHLPKLRRGLGDQAQKKPG